MDKFIIQLLQILIFIPDVPDARIRDRNIEHKGNLPALSKHLQTCRMVKLTVLFKADTDFTDLHRLHFRPDTFADRAGDKLASCILKKSPDDRRTAWLTARASVASVRHS